MPRDQITRTSDGKTIDVVKAFAESYDSLNRRIRTDASISGDVNVDIAPTDSGCIIGKTSGGDFVTAYASGTTVSCAGLPTYHSTLIDQDVVIVVQINSSGSVVKTYTRDDTIMTVAGNVITVNGATFAGTDTFVVYTNIARQADYQIGAVEIKNATDDTRAVVKPDGTNNALVVVQNIQPLPTGAATELTLSGVAVETGGNLDTIATDTTSIDGKITTCDTGNVTIVSNTTDFATESTLSSIDGKVTTCDTGNISGDVTSNSQNIATETTLNNIYTRQADKNQWVKLTDGTNDAGIDSQNHLYVAGKSATGIAPTSNPVSISGIDEGGLKRGLLTDVKGRVVTTTQTPSRRYIDVSYGETIDVVAINLWRNAIRYTIPAGYNFDLVNFQIAQGNNTGFSRLIKEVDMATYNLGTNVFTDKGSYTSPEFASGVYAVVTTVLTGAATTLTVTYVNQDGVGGRTGSIAMTAAAALNSQFEMTLQAGDYGVRDITNVTEATAATGIVELYGYQVLFNIDNLNANQYSVWTPSRESMVLPAGSILSLQWMNTAAGAVLRSLRAVGVLVAI